MSATTYDPSEELAANMSGEHIATMLRSKGPIVSCVLLRATKVEQNDDSKPAAVLDEKEEDNDAKTKASNPDSPVAQCTDDDETHDDASSDVGGNKKREVLTHLIDEIKVDTTPKKSMVSQILGGPFTFLGQYEDEGIMVIVRQPDEDMEDGDDDLNPHQLQPPLHLFEVRGDILLMRVAATEDEDKGDDGSDGEEESSRKNVEEQAQGGNDENASAGSDVDSGAASGIESPGKLMSNEEFFLDYTKDEYIKFASRTDIIPPPQDEDDQNNEGTIDDEGESDEEDSDGEEDLEDGEYAIGSDEEEDDEECQIGMMNLILAQILKRFREENGRGPNTEELLAMRSALAEKLGIDESIINADGSGNADGSEVARRKRKSEVGDSSGEKRVKFTNKDEVKIMSEDEGASESDDEDYVEDEKKCSATA